MLSKKITPQHRDGSSVRTDHGTNPSDTQDSTHAVDGENHDSTGSDHAGQDHSGQGTSGQDHSGQDSSGQDHTNTEDLSSGDHGDSGPDLTNFDDDFTMSSNSSDSDGTIHSDNVDSWSHSDSHYSVTSHDTDGDEHSTSVDVHSSHENEDDDDHDDDVPCFCKGTLIETLEGIVPVETLGVGDMVRCGDGVCRPVRWISERQISKSDLSRHPEFRPIRIQHSALGENLPNTDLLVSPQHRILLDDWRAEIMFGEPEVLVAAVHLINGADIARDFSVEEVSYFHFMFDTHQTVFSNGMKTESFFPGERAVNGLDAAVREELFSFFPELEFFPRSYGETCALELKAHETLAMLGA